MLQFGCHVDQEVAATQKIEFCKRRIHDQILWREDHHLADGVGDTKSPFGLGEIAVEALCGYIRGNVGWEDARTRLLDGIGVKIRGKNLQRDSMGQL